LDLTCVGLGALFDELPMQADPGVVDQDIDRPAQLTNSGLKLGAGPRHRQVGGDDVDHDPGMLGGKPVAQRFEFVGASCDQHEIGAALCELDGEFLADPSARARDQRGVVVEFHPWLHTVVGVSQASR